MAELITVPVVDARKHFSELVNRVRFGRERFDIARHQKPVVSLIRPEDREKLEKLEEFARNLGFSGVKQLLQALVSDEELLERLREMQSELGHVEEEKDLELVE